MKPTSQLLSHIPRRLIISSIVPVILILLGTLGYWLIEDWTLFDSLYMTVITLTTVGFNEVHALSHAGRVFTMLLAMGGVFTLFYAVTSVISAVVSGELHAFLGSRRMERSLTELSGHFIVCGYGRMGRLVCEEFSTLGMQFVVVDREAGELEPFELPHGIALRGDATSDDVLERAGVRRAKALITVVASDAENLFITMSARVLNDRLFIVARAENDSGEQKLLRAGANRVVSPYVIGGRRVAQAVLRPTVVDFLELATRSEHLELNIEETTIAPNSRLLGTTVQESKLRHEHGLIIVAIKKASGRMVFNPPSDAIFEAQDILIMLGRREDLDQVESLAKG